MLLKTREIGIGLTGILEAHETASNVELPQGMIIWLSERRSRATRIVQAQAVGAPSETLERGSRAGPRTRGLTVNEGGQTDKQTSRARC